MAKIAIDANVPISFIDKKIDFWNDFIRYATSENHDILMPDKVFDEVIDRQKRQVFKPNKCDSKNIC